MEMKKKTQIIKRYILKKQRNPEIILDNNKFYNKTNIKRNKIISYTISKRLSGNHLEKKLLDDNSETPDRYFENVPKLIKKEDKTEYELRAMDIRTSDENIKLNSILPELKDRNFFSIQKSKPTIDLYNQLVKVSKKTSKVKLNEIQETIISGEYDGVNERISRNYDINKSIKTFDIMKEFIASKQERSFMAFNKTQQQWNKYLCTTSSSLERKPENSIFVRSGSYRKKVELNHISENNGPGSYMRGNKGWYMSLRDYSNGEDRDHYLIPVGNSYTGLWMTITNVGNKQFPIVRSTLKTERVPIYIKQLAIKKGNHDNLENMIVQGANAFNVEIEGYKKCNKKKVLILSCKNDDVLCDSLI